MPELIALTALLLPVAIIVLCISMVVCFFKINGNVRRIRELLERQVTGLRPGEKNETEVNEWAV